MDNRFLGKYTPLYKEAQKSITEAILAPLGIDLATAKKLGIGYIEHWTPEEDKYSKPSQRFILPFSGDHYIALDATEPEKEGKPNFVRIGQPENWIYRAEIIETAPATEPIFITSSALDALAVIATGEEAIALTKTTHIDKLVNLLRESNRDLFIIISTQNPVEGEYLQTALEGSLVTTYRVELTTPTESAFSRHKRDRASFMEALASTLLEEKSARKEARTKTVEELEKNTALAELGKFKEKIEKGTAPVIIPTGFSNLDSLLAGGLRSGLYVLGAISSLGKTSLLIQLADNIAKQGRSALYISLEMAREELVAKCISRLSYERSMKKYGRFNTAQTTFRILDTHKYKSYELDTQEIVKDAIEELEARAQNLIILEGVGELGVADIRAKAQTIKNLQGTAPVIFIDYLQILAPTPDYRGTDKQITDKNILELKRLSRDLNTPVVCISSFNRDNYREPVSTYSFKESGAIEYTCDVLLGLQYKGMDYTEGEKQNSDKRRERIDKVIETARANGRSGQPQALEIKVLKNRNALTGKSAIDFVPMFNYFSEPEPEEDAPERWESWGE